MFLLGYFEGRKLSSYQILRSLRGKYNLFMSTDDGADLMKKLFVNLSEQGLCINKTFLNPMTIF